jgi:NADH-quinone oxidoreductase subunit L
MALALIVLAVGSIGAGYIGLPHAFGHNVLAEWLAPSFQAMSAGAAGAIEGAGAAAEASAAAADHGAAAEHGAADETALEITLMAVSSAIALLGIGMAWFIWNKRRDIAASMARRFSGVHRLLLNKYYVDELYDQAIVKPIRVLSDEVLWRSADVKLIDGAVNGAANVVDAGSVVLRRLQSGSVRTYAGSVVVGVVVILGYYLWR